MLDDIAECVRWICSYLSGRSVTSEEEVERLVFRWLVRNFKKADEMFVDSVKKALFDEPVSLSCFFPDRVEGLFTFHGHSPETWEKKEAVEEMLRARRISDGIDVAKTTLSGFFGVRAKEDLPYLVFERDPNYRVFVSDVWELERDIDFHIMAAERFEEVYAVVVLTEKTPLPFVKFFKKHSERVRIAKLLVWVLDPEREWLNPFIGYPPDRELIGRFRNPRLATEIESLWRVNVREF